MLQSLWLRLCPDASPGCLFPWRRACQATQYLLFSFSLLLSIMWFPCYLNPSPCSCWLPETCSALESHSLPSCLTPVPLPDSFSHTAPTLLAEPRPPLQTHLASVSMNYFSQTSFATSCWPWPGSHAGSLSAFFQSSCVYFPSPSALLVFLGFRKVCITWEIWIHGL